MKQLWHENKGPIITGAFAVVAACVYGGFQLIAAIEPDLYHSFKGSNTPAQPSAIASTNSTAQTPSHSPNVSQPPKAPSKSGWLSWLTPPPVVGSINPTLSISLPRLLEIQNAIPTDENLAVRKNVKGTALLEGYVLTKTNNPGAPYEIELGPLQTSKPGEGVSISFYDHHEDWETLKVGDKARVYTYVHLSREFPAAPFYCDEEGLAK
jgi:hypothetical protein